MRVTVVLSAEKHGPSAEEAGLGKVTPRSANL